MISFTNWIICSRHLKLICGVYQKPSVHVVFVFRVFDIDLERIGNIARLGVPISGIRLVRLKCLCVFYPNGTPAESVMQCVKVALVFRNDLNKGYVLFVLILYVSSTRLVGLCLFWELGSTLRKLGIEVLIMLYAWSLHTVNKGVQFSSSCCFGLHDEENRSSTWSYNFRQLLVLLEGDVFWNGPKKSLCLHVVFDSMCRQYT
ncbi:hypothetical protein MUK42_28447 [Musa troglodytarum]|uniref:Uncharacterized protein n=1 Tax=Musa troglodytarum TaxID=320322 RepID=A0A9E7F0U9_9LILI|nr:hypothetical protein MUK42_28447 [Musa troglodytarum]